MLEILNNDSRQWLQLYWIYMEVAKWSITFATHKKIINQELGFTLVSGNQTMMTTSRFSSLLCYSRTFPHFQKNLCNNTDVTTTVAFSSRRRRVSSMAVKTREQEMVLGEEEEEKKKLQLGIAEFYDESSGIWENIWGDHMHHGFYDPDSTVSVSDHRAAQIRMIEQSLAFASLSQEDPTKWPKSVVDVGCGIGGSSRYLAKKFGASCSGITLSPVQAERANALAAAQGLSDKVSFQVADALEQPFPDGQFDLVWSMESGEHMPNKAKFVGELARVAAPGGTIIIVTWCHRDLRPDEKSLQPWEENLLKKICDSFYLPAWCSTAEYVELLETLSLQDIKSADWSPFVAPFWPAVIRSALTWKGFTSILRSGLKTIKGALAMPLMIEGFRKGVIKFAIITCRKPENRKGE